MEVEKVSKLVASYLQDDDDEAVVSLVLCSSLWSTMSKQLFCFPKSMFFVSFFLEAIFDFWRTFFGKMGNCEFCWYNFWKIPAYRKLMELISLPALRDVNKLVAKCFLSPKLRSCRKWREFFAWMLSWVNIRALGSGTALRTRKTSLG